MVKLISIHIPKTAGTSFYNILQQVYGQALSPSLRRKDLPGFPKNIHPAWEVLHGHFTFEEVRPLFERDQPKVICWLRDPAERVFSNYRFFIRGLQQPDRNPQQYELNKHRMGETLQEYAALEENRNRMSKFLYGIQPEDIFFCGCLENFAEDLTRLGQLLDWPPIEIPRLNAQSQEPLSAADRELLYKLNAEDLELYQRILQLKEKAKEA
jgi:hypothetical protein